MRLNLLLLCFSELYIFGNLIYYESHLDWFIIIKIIGEILVIITSHFSVITMNEWQY